MRKINEQIDNLSKRVWQLENPPKYKYGDKAYYRYYDGYCTSGKPDEEYEVKILGYEFDNYCYHYTVDNGTYLETIRHYNLYNEKYKS